MLVLLAVFLVGTAGYVVIERASFSDAAYMTITTLSTVGFKEVFPLSGLGRFWTAMIIVFGIATVFAAFGTVTAMIVSGEVGQLMGSRKLQAQIDKLSEHMIVCGFGRMGALVAEELQRRSVPVVVIENDPARTRDLEPFKLLYLIGDASEENTLRQAGIERARGLIAVLPSDADNVFVTLTARGLRKDLMIVSRAEQPSAEIKLRRAGASRVVSPHAIGAVRIANVLTRPHVVDVLDVAAQGVDLEMDEYSIGSESPLRGRTLRDAQLRQKADVMVVAIKHGDGRTTFNPGPETIIDGGDRIIIIGPAGSASKLKALQMES